MKIPGLKVLALLSYKLGMESHSDSAFSQTWSSNTEHSEYSSENETQFTILTTVWDTVGEEKCTREKKPFIKVVE